MAYDKTLDSKVTEVFNSNELYFKMMQRWHDLHGGLAVESEVKEIIESQCQPGARILEAGSGSGSITNWFAIRNPDVWFVGVDISCIGVHIAYENAPENAEFQVADLKRLPYEDNIFNFAFSQSVLEHVVGWDIALTELYRVLLPNGRLLIRLGNAGVRNTSSLYKALLNYLLSRNKVFIESPSFKLQDDNWDDHHSNFDVQGIPSDILLDVLMKLGFSILYFSTGTYKWRQSKAIKPRLVSYLNFWPFNHLGYTTIVLVKK